MACITLKFKDLALKEYPLESGHITIGREPGNDIVLENLLVSGYHARIDKAGNDCILTDLQSKNGSFVNGERITSAKLKNGDQILVGKHTLVFNLEPSETEVDDKLTEATMFMDVAQGAAQPPTEQPQNALRASGATGSGKRLAVLCFLTGGTEEYELAKKLVRLGKGQEADIHVGGIFTPKVAATISMRPTGYHLTPVGRVKIKVNGAQVKGSYRLREFDTVEVGSARLQFYYKD